MIACGAESFHSQCFHLEMSVFYLYCLKTETLKQERQLTRRYDLSENTTPPNWPTLMIVQDLLQATHQQLARPQSTFLL